jgi:4-amino-4-deoxy-L-arabinose transferase-like glycosyltransferase
MTVPTDQPDAVPSPTAFRTAVALLLVLHALLLVCSSWNKSPTYDEPAHLKFGLAYLDQGGPREADAQRMPVTQLNAAALKLCGGTIEDCETDQRYLLCARLPTMVASLLLGLGLFCWSANCYGRWGGLLTLTLYCLCPTVIAHGRLVTNDLYTALAMAAAVWSFRRLCLGPSVPLLLLSGACLGLAQACKFSAVVLLPAFAVILLFSRDSALLVTWLGEKLSRWGLMLLYPAMAFLVLGAVYRFDGMFLGLDGFEFHSYAFAWLKARGPWLRLPLPMVYLEGLDLSRYISTHPEVIRGHNYLFGRLSDDGWWYYFLVVGLLKTPLGTLGLLALRIFRPLKSAVAAASWTCSAFTLVPALALLVFFSLFSSVQLGIRYLLPALPLIFVWAGGLLDQKSGKTAQPGRPLKLAVAVMLAATAVSSLAAFPDYISYTGELAGPRISAWRLMADSNLEWGQDHWYLQQYLQQHPEAQLNPKEPASGHLVVRVNLLTGVFQEERYRWLRNNFSPVDMIRGSYLVYRISEDELAEVCPEPRSN